MRWPKSFSEYQKKVMPLVQSLVTRTEAVLRSRLLIRPSELRRMNTRTGQYDLLIGNGLFSKELIRAGTQVVYFCGKELLGYEAVQEARVTLGTLFCPRY